MNLRGAAASTPFVTDIDYNAKGQRTLIDYGNGVRTTYEYDPLTFRLTRLTTTRPAGLNGLATQLFKDARTVQDLNYTYDPAGNITRIADDALPTLFFANQQVDPVGLYTYDAVYRLIKAQGRESIGQSALQLGLPAGDLPRLPVRRARIAALRPEGRAQLHRAVRIRRGRKFPAHDPPGPERRLAPRLPL